MADYSRRPQRNHRSLSKHFSSVFSKVGGVYDDVLLTRAPKSAAATHDVRDYAEIFSTSKSSSIPFLELDDQFGSREEECWSSKLDYRNVFRQMGDEDQICLRKIDDSLSFSRGSDQSKALEGSQQLNYGSLFKKKHNLSHDKITREGKGEADETSGEAQKNDISVSVSATDGTHPVKSVKDSTSGPATKKLMQCSHDVPVEKYSRIVSSDGLSKHEADGFIEIDMKTGYEYGSDRSIFCDLPMDADIIKFEEHTFDVITPSALVKNLGGPNVTFKDQVSLGSNASEDSSHACISSSRDGVKVQSLDESLVRDSAIEDNPVGKSFLTQDHGGECATPELLMEIYSSINRETAKDGSYNSQQDVKLQSLAINHQMDSCVATAQDSSELTSPIVSQHDVGKLNTVAEVDSSEKIVLGNAYIECDGRALDVDLTKNAKLQNKVPEEMTSIDMREDTKEINLKSPNSRMISPSAVQCNLGNVVPAVKNATILQSGGLTKSTFLRGKDHSTSSSDDKIDKNSEAAIFVSAAKKAMQEAQVWISVAKESDGVKGFMKPPVVARTFGQVKVVKEVYNYKVEDTPNLFELGQPTFENNCSVSSTAKGYIDPWSTKPDIKLAPSPSISAGKEITFREPVFFVSHGQNQKEDEMVDSSSEDKVEVNSTLQISTPCINTSEEKLALYNNEEEMKSIHGKGDTTIQCMADLSPVAIVEEAYSYEAPKVGKTEIAVMSTDNCESFLDEYGDNNTFTGVNEAENEPQVTLSSRDQSFKMRTFPDNFDQCQDDHPAINIELKNLVSKTEQMTFHSKQNEVIKAGCSCVATACSDDSENDLTSLEEQNMKETKRDPLDEVSDYEDFQDYASAEESLASIDTDDEIYEKDSNLPSQFQFSEIEDIMMQNMTAQETIMIEDVSNQCFSNLHDEETKRDPTDEVSDYEDFQDYASAEESLASIDTDDEIYEKDSNLPSQSQFSEIEDIMMQNMTAQEAIMIKEDVSNQCFSNLHDEQTNNGSHEREDMPLENMVITEEKTVLSVVNSAEESVNGMADESDNMQLQNMVIFEIAPEDRGNIFLNNSNKNAVDKQQTDVSVDFPVLNMVTPEAKDTGEDDGPRVEVMTEHKMAIPEKDNISEKDIALPFEISNASLMVAEIEADTNATRESRGCSPYQKLEKGVVGDEIEELESASGVEFASKVDYVCSHSDGSEVELICTGSITDESEANKIKEFRSMLSTRDKAQQEKDAAFFCDFEPMTLRRHELCDVVTIEAEIIEKGHEASKDVAGQEDPIKLESTPLYPESDNHEEETGIHFSQPLSDNMKNEATPEFEHQVSNLIYDHINGELESGMQFPEPHPNSVEDEQTSEFEQQGDKLMSEHVNSEFESGIQFCEPLLDNLKNEGKPEFEQLGDNLIFEQVNHEVGAGIQFFKPLSDKIMNEETTEFDRQGHSLISEHVNSETQSGKEVCESCSDTIKNEETADFEQQGENLSQLAERHGRKKWEIPKESFEQPKLKVETLDLQDTGEKGGLEVKNQIEKHERKKWEIPVETFELPTLGDDGILEESEEIVRQDRENNTKSAAKPERKKWKIQKDMYEVPLLSDEAAEQTSRQDGFVVVTEFKEVMRMTDNIPTNLMDFEETCQHVGLQKEISANVEAVVPSERDLSEICDKNTQEHVKKEHLPDTKMLYQEEKENQLNENSDQREARVEKGKSDEQGDCPKVLEDINVKDEIKRTLGMFWKRIYTSKQDEEFESVELEAQEETFKRGVYMDLNLTGPVELVESPRQQDDIQVFNFSERGSGIIENTEEISYVNQFEVNESKTCNSEEFISTTGPSIEVQKITMSVADSGNLEAVGDKSCAEEKCEQYYKYNANDQASHSEDMQSSNGSEDLEELAQNHEPDESQQGKFSKTNIFPSDVNESHLTDSEMVSRFEALLADDSLLSDAENTRKVKLVIQDEESKYDEMVNTTLKAGARSVNQEENYFKDGVEALLGDGFPDRNSTGTEQQDMSMTSGGQDSNPISSIEVANGMPSDEPKVNDKEEECGDKSNEQDDELEIILLDKEKENIKKEADEISTHLPRKEKLIDDHPSEAEDRTKDCLYKKVTVNEEVLESILRAKERERSMVKRAIREAHERAFAEARERAAMEKAKAEASQEESINGQEWLQTASSEAKLATEENSKEAKRKAVLERAAVERATVEARQRALEKTMSQKEQASHGSSSSSNGASNDQYGSCSQDGINYDNSSESALRFKIMNERDQQIAERASKALEEKNMRDLLVQREQAERNRLAEVLDADFKKWANGKTGNLRALLSTIQYVLGRDSGWQPISLIDIVTTDAVKKAYRKATLFLHPDKLQQRGATIKQKYICEKVFDLLKEAWNRFDREER